MADSYFNATGAGQDLADRPKWWDQRGSLNTATAVNATLGLLKSYQDRRTAAAVWNARLYGNLALSSAFGVIFSELQTSSATSPSNRLTYNVIAECLDTIVARVAARIKPRPYWVTSGGTYKQKRRAKRLNKFCDGLLAEQNAHRLAVACFRDAAVFGTGIAGVVWENERIKLERVIPSEIWVDEHESLHGNPRQMHRVKVVDRGTVMEMWPSKKGEIVRQALARVDNVATATPSLHELIEVRESWRLPDGPKSPGRHVVTINECTLLDEDWTHNWFPFVFLRYTDPLSGIWGHGLVEQLSDIQLHINKFLWVISRALHLHGSTKILVEQTSNVVPSHITNNPSSIIGYRGTAPQWLAPPAVPVELYQQVEVQIERAHQRAGVSRLSSAGQKPPGLNAAVALREFLEVEQDRFSTLSEQYEQFFVDLVRQSVELIADAVEREEIPNYKVTSYGLRGGQVVDWESIDFDADMFSLRCFPTSSLPLEPAARQQTVTEWVQAGWVDERRAKKLLDFPDLEAADTLEQAAEEWIEHCLDSIMDSGEYIAPDAEDDLAVARLLVSQEIQAAKLGAPDEDDDDYNEYMRRVDDLRKFRDAVIALQTPEAPPAVPGTEPLRVGPNIPTPPAATPLAAPMPLPQSPLIPQV